VAPMLSVTPTCSVYLRAFNECSRTPRMCFLFSQYRA
jgi:hypothetical protein